MKEDPGLTLRKLQDESLQEEIKILKSQAILSIEEAGFSLISESGDKKSIEYEKKTLN